MGAADIGFDGYDGARLGLAPQASGYHGIETSPGFPGPFVVLDARGGVLSSGGTVGDPVSMAGDPGGGSAVLTFTDYFGPNRTPRLERVDSGGRRIAVAVLDQEPTGLAVAASGDALVLAGARGRWFDRAALPLTPWFEVPAYVDPARPNAPVSLRPLADGSLALRQAGSWKLVFQDAAAAAEPPPGWLTAQSGREVAVVRGGRANAIVPLPHAGCGPARVEVFTAAGESCGAFELPGGSCAGVAFGADGTAFAVSFDAATVTWRWWAKLMQ